MKSVLIVFLFLKMSDQIKRKDKDKVLRRVFGSGEIDPYHQKESEKYITSSMEDLLELCRYEVSIQDQIRQLPQSDLKKKYLKNAKFHNVSCEEYMLHPINTLFSLYRINNHLLPIFELPVKYQTVFKYLSNIETQALHGLLNIQDYYDLEIKHMIDGNVAGYQSRHKLTSEMLHLLLKLSMETKDLQVNLQSIILLCTSEFSLNYKQEKYKLHVPNMCVVFRNLASRAQIGR